MLVVRINRKHIEKQYSPGRQCQHADLFYSFVSGPEQVQANIRLKRGARRRCVKGFVVMRHMRQFRSTL
ncbi:hypothetical protein CLAIMM_14030 [Cladophialophora immunda]|nr:hypothetical protein CLAIMM_14030 [Cladophialophora immunda]